MWTEDKIEETIKKIQKKSETDKTFRQMVISDPLKAVEQIAGDRPPANIQIKVVENSKDTVNLVLPEFAGDELDDNDLEQVAGGRNVCNDKRSCNVFNH